MGDLENAPDKPEKGAVARRWALRGTVAAIPVGGFAALALWQDWGTAQLGPWSGWVAGALSLAALAVAIRNADRAQATADAARDEADERLHQAQAEMVSGWIHREGDEPELRLSNASHVPVYNVAVYCVFDAAVGGYDSWESLELGFEEDDMDWGPMATNELVPIVQVLPPGNFAILGVDLAHLKMSNRADTSVVFRAEIVFVDAAGTPWTRRANGKLLELKAPAKHPLELESVQRRINIADGFHPYVKIKRLN